MSVFGAGLAVVGVADAEDEAAAVVECYSGCCYDEHKCE